MRRGVRIFIIILLSWVLIASNASPESTKEYIYAHSSLKNHIGGGKEKVIYATYAEGEHEMRNALLLVESLRTFGGNFKDAPVWVYTSRFEGEIGLELKKRFRELDVEIRRSEMPEDAGRFYYSGKVFAAAEAERAAEGLGKILVWLDNDTIFLSEPSEFLIPEAKALGYKPVMHINIGSLYSEPPDDFWSRVYQRLNISAASIFPMLTITDHLEIRPYFNAGILAVRPENEIMRRWAKYYAVLYRDNFFIELGEHNEKIRIFLHQAALVGAVLNHVGRDEMLEFSAGINYPLFFKEMFGADLEYDNLEGVVTLRYDYYFRNPAPDWSSRLKGPQEKISWLVQKLGR